MTNPPTATRVRYAVISVTTLAAFFLYLDRVCMSEIIKTRSFQSEFGLDKEKIGAVLSAFFFAYALAQVPAGWLSDRFGTRKLMTIYIATWSFFTLLTGLAVGLWSLLLARIGCGVAEAGAYPASAGLLSRWAPFSARGAASGIVSFGGRLGGAMAPYLTVLLVAALGTWRPVGWIYGLAGIVVAVIFWQVFRESPAEHPRCNAAERALIAHGRPAFVGAGSQPIRLQLHSWVRSKSLWLMCAYMAGSNIGWAFLITWAPTYLGEIKHVDPLLGGKMVMLVLISGMAGLFLGGWFTDACTRRMGLRWGRAVPLITARVLATSAYLSCLWLDSVWGLVAAFAVVSFATDLSNPASWAFIQDIGGRQVGAVLGWANMWGNLGASATAGLVPLIIQGSPNWHSAFIFLAAAFALCCVVAFGIDASEPIKDYCTASAGKDAPRSSES